MEENSDAVVSDEEELPEEEVGDEDQDSGSGEGENSGDGDEVDAEVNEIEEHPGDGGVVDTEADKIEQHPGDEVDVAGLVAVDDTPHTSSQEESVHASNDECC